MCKMVTHEMQKKNDITVIIHITYHVYIRLNKVIVIVIVTLLRIEQILSKV